uniref:Uncharacterized protein n=1 Tax=Alexandrium catenella TaxID=2925 RepID=A0A7S1LDX4_ALECA
MAVGPGAKPGEEEADVEGCSPLLPPAANQGREARHLRLPAPHGGRRGPQGRRPFVVSAAKAAAVLLAVAVVCIASRALAGHMHFHAGEAQGVAILAEENASAANGTNASAPTAWPHGTCSESWGDCLQSRCCVVPGQRCFRKNERYAQCRTACTLGLNDDDVNTAWWTSWRCEKWDMTEESNCAVDHHEDCRRSRCCKTRGHLCFVKDYSWAGCKSTCEEGAWKCTVL